MDTSIFLARMIGPLLMLIGVGTLMNPEHYKAMTANFLKNSELYYFSGAIAFTVGMVIVLFHNQWTGDWRGVITIIGWMSLFKGAVRILFPTLGSKMAVSITESKWELRAGAVLALLVGAWLTWEGFSSAWL